MNLVPTKPYQVPNLSSDNLSNPTIPAKQFDNKIISCALTVYNPQDCIFVKYLYQVLSCKTIRHPSSV